MHNWYEGVLQHHFRYRWGFDKSVVQGQAEQFDEPESEFDEMDIDAEAMEVDDGEEFDKDGKHFVSYLSGEAKQKIKKRMTEVVVPKGVSRITEQAGDASYGKLKASEWRVLFGVYIPLVALDSFWEDEPQNNLLLINTGALIQCTSIIGANQISKNDQEEFAHMYGIYQLTSAQLFPSLKVTPNHHYSMHIPEQLAKWGPLMGIAEFGGERLVGVLQNFESNSRNGAMEETIIKKFGQMQ
ncbi:hypothetical protein O181_129055 [Austropuccinia psidii MF-1]|uniref:Uncharacterized protein n=1 Tax=Austropuccinia psidii MF-1 TaxID=1389203 RepID=A0A9Q3Q9L6_9BASI|nr:hypothetical protein [Austropuccinia psidii MF-1]